MGAGIKKHVVKSKNEYKNKKPTTRVELERKEYLVRGY